ncbi:MAG: hypothetical protein GAK43_02404 [Stenotrophomonas maltophilia]|nr:MAG: hypothetical protein GAK43_02404 [Stenotrophomonas maltophilia]
MTLAVILGAFAVIGYLGWSHSQRRRPRVRRATRRAGSSGLDGTSFSGLDSYSEHTHGHGSAWGGSDCGGDSGSDSGGGCDGGGGSCD